MAAARTTTSTAKDGAHIDTGMRKFTQVSPDGRTRTITEVVRESAPGGLL